MTRPEISSMQNDEFSHLESTELECVMRVGCAQNILFTSVALVCNAFPAVWRLIFQSAFPKNGDVMLGSHKWSSNPHQRAVSERQSELIVKASLIELVGVQLCIFS